MKKKSRNKNDARCPNCGHFLSKFAVNGYRAEFLKVCYKCKAKLTVKGNKIITDGFAYDIKLT